MRKRLLHSRRPLLAALPLLLIAFVATCAGTAAAGRTPPLPRLVVGSAWDEGKTKVGIFSMDFRTGGTGVQRLRVLKPFGKKARGAARVAGGNLNGDFFPDMIVGRGFGQRPQVRCFDGSQFKPLRGALGRFNAFDARFRGGVYVGRGDINRDGTPDVVVAAGEGGTPAVRVFNGEDGSQLASFNAYAPAFPGGVRVAVGDVNGDGFADIITGAGPGAGPHVRVFSGDSLRVIFDFMALDEEFNGGVQVAAGDVNGDGRADIVVGAGPAANPQVQVFNGLDGELIRNFLAFDPQFLGGVTVAAGDVNGDGRAEVIAGAASQGGTVKIFDADDLEVLQSVFPFGPNYNLGVNVAYAF